MNYYICFNEDYENKFPCTHEETLDEALVVKDVTVGYYPENIIITKIELVDSEGQIWAMRRFPRPGLAISLGIEIQCNWVLTMCCDFAHKSPQSDFDKER